MRFIRKHGRKMLISILLILIAFFALAYWSAKELANPPRRPIVDYHQEYLNNPAAHGVELTRFTTSAGTPSIICQPDPSGSLGARGHKIRADLTAAGITLPPPGKIIGTLVLIHGRKGRKEDYLPIAERLCAVGFRCVLFDLPAHGENPEPTVTFGFREAGLPAEVLADAADQFHFDPYPAGIFGMSMGGSVAVHSAAQFDSPWKAVVIVASFDTLPAVVKEKATSRAGETLGSIWFCATDRLFKFKTGISTNAVRPANLAAQLKIPTLIAHGTDDRIVPIESGRRLFQALPDSTPKKWIEIPAAGHDNLLITDFPIYAEIASWFLNHL